MSRRPQWLDQSTGVRNSNSFRIAYIWQRFFPWAGQADKQMIMQLDLCREKHEWTLREQVVLMCVRGTIRTGTDVYAAESSAGQAE